MSAYARYIRRRALRHGPPGAAFAGRQRGGTGPTAPSRPASGKRLLEISDSDAAKLLAVLKLLG